MTHYNQFGYMDDSDCHYLSSDTQKYLFKSPTEICHWNSSVWDSLSSSPDSSEDLSEVSSQSADSSRGYSDSLSTCSMEHGTNRSISGFGQWSPEMENMPEPDCYPIWMDIGLQGNAPFSPVPSAFTLPFSDTGFSVGQSVTQELPMADPFVSANWSAEIADRSYIDESSLSEQSLFPSFHEHAQSEVMQAGYQSWFTPTEVNFEHYFQMDPPQGTISGFTPVAPQTAGFVGSTSTAPSSQAGPGYQRSAPGDFESVTATHMHSQASVPNAHVASAYHETSRQARQSPELTSSRPPRRISMAIHPSAAWNPEDTDRKPYRAAKLQQGHSQGPNAGARSRGHRESNVSYVGSPGSVLSSTTSSVALVETERSLSAISTVSTGAKNDDNEGKARSDPLYSTTRPRADGFYHCPFVTKENCAHKPTKLKCNFDKYIDSHLKPFICKQKGCVEPGSDGTKFYRFSSTACLLRHEREAHGLHGHGTKPYLCNFPGCERAVPGNGFPRNYNLMDHMKRVHKWDKAPSSPGSSNGRRGTRPETFKIRKRKDTTKKAGSSTSSRRQTVSSASTLPSQEYHQQMAELHACNDKLQQHLRRMQNPKEAAQYLTREISQRYG